MISHFAVEPTVFAENQTVNGFYESGGGWHIAEVDEAARSDDISRPTLSQPRTYTMN